MANKDKLKQNNRVGIMLNMLNKMPAGEQELILQQATYYLQHVNTL